jgi:RNA polymerase sigma-70 factor, ECF subfamily
VRTRDDAEQSERQRDFERRIAACRRSAYAIAYHMLADAAEAEDVTQEGCVRAWLHYDAYDPRRPFEPWLLRIVRNLAIDAQRRRIRRRSVSLDTTERRADEGPWLTAADRGDYGDPQAQVMAVAEGERMLEAMTGLPSPHRQVLWLLYYRQESYEAIAKELDCPIGTVRSRVFRARKAARAALAHADAAI